MQLQDRPAIAGLLAAGADVGAQTAEGETALHIVCRQGAPRVLAQLLETASAVAALDRQTSASLGRQTALHVALAHRDPRSARQLLALGCAVDLKDGAGDVALHPAARHGARSKTLLSWNFLL